MPVSVGVLDVEQQAWKLYVHLMGMFRVAEHPKGTYENHSANPQGIATHNANVQLSFANLARHQRLWKLAEHKVPWFFPWLSAFPADRIKKQR